MENLITTLAENSQMFSKSTITKKDIKLDFSGFYDGSAVPAFKIADTPILMTETAAQLKRDVIGEFDLIMRDVDQRDYSSIRDRYNDPKACNEVIKKVFHFTNSGNGHPLNIVKRDGQRFKDVYRVRTMSKKALNRLLKPQNIEVEPEESRAIARMIITKNKDGKVTQKPSEIYKDEKAVLSFKLDHIDYLDRHYSFYAPVLFHIYKEGSGYIIENEQLDLYASAATESDAKINLYGQFDDSYQRFEELKNEQLGKRLLRVKQYMNNIVKSVNTD